jgi:hypothetical protein
MELQYTSAMGCGMKLNELISYVSQLIGFINFLHHCFKNCSTWPPIPNALGEQSSEGLL